MERAEIIQMFNNRFGTSVDLRMRKLEEEFNELKEVHEADPFKNDGNLSDFIDELADLNAVLFHIAGILGLSQEQLLSMSVDKVVGREKDPNYKRKHPHKQRDFEKDKYLTVDEAIRYLKVCRTSLWRYSKMGILKPRKIGGRILYSRADIDDNIKIE